MVSYGAEVLLKNLPKNTSITYRNVELTFVNDGTDHVDNKNKRHMFRGI